MDYNDSVLCLDKQKNRGEHYRIQVDFLLECEVKLTLSSCMTFVAVTPISVIDYGRLERALLDWKSVSHLLVPQISHYFKVTEETVNPRNSLNLLLVQNDDFSTG